MSYNFLRNYTIPTKTATQSESYNDCELQKIDSICYNYYEDPSSAAGSVEPFHSAELSYEINGYENSYLEYGTGQMDDNYLQEEYYTPSRYVAPGKQYQGLKCRGAQQPAWRKRKFSTGPGATTGSRTTTIIQEQTADGKLIMFKGRDESFPDELNKLIHPTKCEVCKTTMNSIHSAKDHYDSKVHNRNLTTWLNINYVDKGLEPPAIKRAIKEGPSGPDAFHCVTCDLKLTSLTHANQHYSGRRHRLVASNISKPSGAGYYNNDGKWIRTGSKLVPHADGDGRFAIGEQFKYAADCSSATPDTTTANDVRPAVAAIATATAVASETTAIVAVVAQEGLTNRKDLCCKLCNVSVTSSSQLEMHISGARHIKKMYQKHLSGAIETPETAANSTTLTEAANAIKAASSTIAAKTILDSLNDNPLEARNDLSMYRTPSGSYYCQTCNTTMCNVTALSQHLVGKKHVKRSAEEKAKESAVSSASAAGIGTVNKITQ